MKENKDLEDYIKNFNSIFSAHSKQFSGYSSFPKNLLHPEQSQEISPKDFLFPDFVRKLFDLSLDWDQYLKYNQIKSAEQDQQNSERKFSHNKSKSRSSFNSNNIGEYMDDNLSTFNHKKRLVVVRKLRVVTYAIDITNKKNRVLKSINSPVIATILVCL